MVAIVTDLKTIDGKKLKAGGQSQIACFQWRAVHFLATVCWRKITVVAK